METNRIYGHSWVWVGLSRYAPVKTLNFCFALINRKALGAKVLSQKGNSPESTLRSLNMSFVETRVEKHRPS